VHPDEARVAALLDQHSPPFDVRKHQGPSRPYYRVYDVDGRVIIAFRKKATADLFALLVNTAYDQLRDNNGDEA
jgi:hypothetical protein